MSDADTIIELGDQLAAMCESLDDLKQQLAASEEARKKAEEESANMYRMLSAELGGDSYMGEPAIYDDLSKRLRELDVKGYQQLTGAIGEEASNAIKALRKRAEASEKLIEDSRKQEPYQRSKPLGASGLPVADEWVNYYESIGCPNGRSKTLYEYPPIPPELSEVMRERDDLKRKLAEQESHNNFDAARLRRLCTFCGVAAPESDEELLQVAGVVIGSCLRVLQSPSSMIDPHSEIGVLKHHLSCKNSQIEELNRLLSEARKVPEWQPIETAPKDKTRILIFSEKHGVREAKFYRETAEGTEWYDNMCGGGPLTWFYDVSYWMPLPASQPERKN